MSPIDPKRVKFGGSAKYKIIVQGVVDPSWSDRLGGMAITCRGPDEDNPRTTLLGWIHDQAELRGVLETLYGLHCPILKIDANPDSD